MIHPALYDVSARFSWQRFDPRQVSYYREALAWTNDDVASMLGVYPDFLSIKMENDVIEVIDYLR